MRDGTESEHDDDADDFSQYRRASTLLLRRSRDYAWFVADLKDWKLLNYCGPIHARDIRLKGALLWFL